MASLANYATPLPAMQPAVRVSVRAHQPELRAPRCAVAVFGPRGVLLVVQSLVQNVVMTPYDAPPALAKRTSTNAPSNAHGSLLAQPNARAHTQAIREGPFAPLAWRSTTASSAGGTHAGADSAATTHAHVHTQSQVPANSSANSAASSAAALVPIGLSDVFPMGLSTWRPSSILSAWASRALSRRPRTYEELMMTLECVARRHVDKLRALSHSHTHEWPDAPAGHEWHHMSSEDSQRQTAVHTSEHPHDVPPHFTSHSRALARPVDTKPAGTERPTMGRGAQTTKVHRYMDDINEFDPFGASAVLQALSRGQPNKRRGRRRDEAEEWGPAALRHAGRSRRRRDRSPATGSDVSESSDADSSSMSGSDAETSPAAVGTTGPERPASAPMTRSPTRQQLVQEPRESSEEHGDAVEAQLAADITEVTVDLAQLSTEHAKAAPAPAAPASPKSDDSVDFVITPARRFIGGEDSEDVVDDAMDQFVQLSLAGRPGLGVCCVASLVFIPAAAPGWLSRTTSYDVAPVSLRRTDLQHLGVDISGFSSHLDFLNAVPEACRSVGAAAAAAGLPVASQVWNAVSAATALVADGAETAITVDAACASAASTVRSTLEHAARTHSLHEAIARRHHTNRNSTDVEPVSMKQRGALWSGSPIGASLISKLLRFTLSTGDLHTLSGIASVLQPRSGLVADPCDAAALEKLWSIADGDNDAAADARRWLSANAGSVPLVSDAVRTAAQNAGELIADARYRDGDVFGRVNALKATRVQTEAAVAPPIDLALGNPEGGLELFILCAACGNAPQACTCPSRKRFRLESERCEVVCCVCEEPVYGLATLCPFCGHGGHVQHLQHWFTTSAECPSGCGCLCNEAGRQFSRDAESKLAQASAEPALQSSHDDVPGYMLRTGTQEQHPDVGASLLPIEEDTEPASYADAAYELDDGYPGAADYD